jgi:signal transduction histidine kinase
VSLDARLAEVRERCENADSENQRLLSALSARESQEKTRISRLEHDLKSPLGVILGFSTLLRENLEEQYQGRPPFLLSGLDGIDQAAEKMLNIIESAADDLNSHASAQKTMAREKIRS